MPHASKGVGLLDMVEPSKVIWRYICVQRLGCVKFGKVAVLQAQRPNLALSWPTRLNQSPWWYFRWRAGKPSAAGTSEESIGRVIRANQLAPRGRHPQLGAGCQNLISRLIAELTEHPAVALSRIDPDIEHFVVRGGKAARSLGDESAFRSTEPDV